MSDAFRPVESVRTDVEIAEWEAAAARRLLDAATYEDRCRVYGEVYDDDNAFWLARHGRLGIAGACARNHALIRHACRDHGPVLDIGGGSGVARDALPPDRTYIVCDASRVAAALPEGASGSIRRVLGYATALPIADRSIGAALVLDVLEHLHEEDIQRCLGECRRVLRPGGHVLIATPNRLSGPWDARSHVCESQTRLGLHLNELTVRRMLRDLSRHGFRARSFLMREYQGRMWSVPPLRLWAGLWETATSLAPRRFRARLCSLAVVLAEAP